MVVATSVSGVGLKPSILARRARISCSYFFFVSFLRCSSSTPSTTFFSGWFASSLRIESLCGGTLPDLLTAVLTAMSIAGLSMRIADCFVRLSGYASVTMPPVVTAWSASWEALVALLESLPNAWLTPRLSVTGSTTRLCK